jgi:hypothetical protein
MRRRTDFLETPVRAELVEARYSSQTKAEKGFDTLSPNGEAIQVLNPE